MLIVVTIFVPIVVQTSSSSRSLSRSLSIRTTIETTIRGRAGPVDDPVRGIQFKKSGGETYVYVSSSFGVEIYAMSRPES